MGELKEKITELLELLQKLFPERRRQVCVAKIQLMPLLLWMPQKVAEAVYSELQPYVKYLRRDELESVLSSEQKLPSVKLPGVPSINLHSMLEELDTEKRAKLATSVCSVFTEAAGALSRKSIGSGRMFTAASRAAPCERKECAGSGGRKRGRASVEKPESAALDAVQIKKVRGGAEHDSEENATRLLGE